jgi:DNA (cytosine-5)-methyltransferase 1
MSTGRVLYNGESSSVVDALFSEFNAFDYECTSMVLKAENFGAPQKRRRLFVLGSNVCDPEIIKQELESISIDGGQKTLNDAIGDLPSLKAGGGIPISAMNGDIVPEEFVWGPKKPRNILYGHVSRPHNAIDMEIIRALKQGMTYKQLSEKHPDILKKREQSKYKVYKTDNFHDKFYRMIDNQPSRTIVSHLAKDGNSFIHPTQNRSITPREAARIQTFSDDYVFFGSRSAQFIQIGNAVPPHMAEIIAKTILKHHYSSNKIHR